LLDKAPISMPMLFLGAGALTFGVIGPVPDPDLIRRGGSSRI
jgi:sodium/hydrogen antiporter